MKSIILIGRNFPIRYLIEHHRMQELSVDQIIAKYQGFEGEFILCYPVPDDQKVMNALLIDFLELKNSINELILYVIENSSTLTSYMRKQSTFLGFDVGLCEYDATIYSSIFNEILFGNLEELISYKELLNENLLFSDESAATEYVKLHDKLSSEGRNVEDYFKMHIYEIWKPNT